jgi:hypothetical protein
VYGGRGGSRCMCANKKKLNKLKKNENNLKKA